MKNARYVKCQYCEETVLYKDRFEKMEIIEKVSNNGKKKNFYYHKENCYNKQLEKQKFIDNELKELDELNNVVKELYNIQFQIPPSIWSIFQDLRNGSNRYTKLYKKKYKKGIPYPVLTEAYKMSKDSILWSRFNKRFKSLESEMTYGIKIMQSKIEDANKKITRSKQSEEISSAREELNALTEDNYSSEKRIKERENKQKYKSKNHIDISSFLDD